MGLLEQAKAKWQGLLDYIDANTPRHAGALPTVGRVVNQGLINPNRFNKPSADRFKESTFGLLGIVPGVGDYASVVESADLFNRGEKFAGGMAALGALPLVPAIGGMFIGKGAKTWDVLKAQQAEELLKQGIDPREVWKQTGTMKGVDGALRQEIPDNASVMSGFEPADEIIAAYNQGGKEAMLARKAELSGYERPYRRTSVQEIDNVFNHSQLADAYPDLFHYGKYQYDSANPRIGEGAYYSEKPGSEYRTDLIKLSPANEPTARSGMLHELQHAIQQREGWARGGSPENSWAAVSDLEDALNSKKETLWAMMRKEIPGDKATQQALRDEIHSMHANYETVASDPMEAYRRLAGEAEARLTQARMNMTMPERLQSYPYDMLDVPQDQLIVRGLLGEDMGPAMHTVYHGSPHKFNKFDMSKIGTGEGAQAYGHGLYFAESPDVAKSYSGKLSSELKYNGKPMARESSRNSRDSAAWALYLADGDKAAAKASGLAKPELIDALDPSKLQPGGQMYKVDIPDEAIPRMLDWDKPLSEQAAIHEQLRPVVEKVYGAGSADYILGRSSATAKTVLDDARRVLGDSGMAESAMKQAGIPGIRYLDGSSRNAGQGTSNFVLFDDQLPRILEVNGQPTGLLSYADEAAQGGGLLGKVDNVPDMSYQIDHKPLAVSGGASTLDDLTGAFGEDIYGKNALQYFGSGMPEERTTLKILQSLRGKPDELVSIFRGVPDGVNSINPGDWVTLDKNVAQMYADPTAYGEAAKGVGKVIEMKVPARTITSWPDSLLEFGYYPD